MVASTVSGEIADSHFERFFRVESRQYNYDFFTVNHESVISFGFANVISSMPRSGPPGTALSGPNVSMQWPTAGTAAPTYGSQRAIARRLLSEQ